MNSPESGEGRLQTYNAFGNLVVDKSVNVNAGNNEFGIELGSDLPPGIYHTRIIMNNMVGNTMVVKSNQ